MLRAVHSEQTRGVARFVGVILAVTAPFWIAPVVFTLMVLKAALFVLGKEDDLF